MTTAYHPWGRVDADGTVYVRTADGERVIGSWQAGSPEEALAFLAPRMHDLTLAGEPAYETIMGIYGLAELPIEFSI